ncbi:hypothetical protein HPB50_004288 [Hyalomma asiaticum]|uniref:Uncharacterized protein n=1 Tax=Hyalomma asiaticum TaxID=266040 RepID=A0ACB7T8E4_HYAAI|nr:hypothetical protein HPB50_004288 [Hyalomma asiaticum]
MDKAAERRARRAAAARARRSDPAVREAEASRDSARRRREDPAVRALTLLTSFIEPYDSDSRDSLDDSVPRGEFSARRNLEVTACNNSFIVNNSHEHSAKGYLFTFLAPTRKISNAHGGPGMGGAKVPRYRSCHVAPTVVYGKSDYDTPYDR